MNEEYTATLDLFCPMSRYSTIHKQQPIMSILRVVQNVVVTWQNIRFEGLTMTLFEESNWNDVENTKVKKIQ